MHHQRYRSIEPSETRNWPRIAGGRPADGAGRAMSSRLRLGIRLSTTPCPFEHGIFPIACSALAVRSLLRKSEAEGLARCTRQERLSTSSPSGPPRASRATRKNKENNMSLIRWKRRPIGENVLGHPISRLQQEMDRLFNRIVQQPWGMGLSDDDGLTRFAGQASQAFWNPSIDISENDNEIVIRADTPGIDSKDVNISVSGRELTISGEKKDSREEGDDNAWYCERSFGSFRRTIELPDNVNLDRISADSHNGVLTVHVPRTEPARRRQIEVKPGAPTRRENKPSEQAATGGGTRRVPVGAV
jgi:HSP20 family protein